MRRLLAPLLLALPVTAQADLGGRQAGVLFDVGGGLGVGDLPFTPGVGWTAAVGGWVGRYDDGYALGRHVAFLARARQDVQLTAGRRELRTAPMFEARRGIDLLVVGVAFGGAIGPLLRTDLESGGTQLVGGTVRAFGSVKYRFHRFVGVGVRLEVGADLDRLRVEPSLGLTLGFEIAIPGGSRED